MFWQKLKEGSKALTGTDYFYFMVGQLFDRVSASPQMQKLRGAAFGAKKIELVQNIFYVPLEFNSFSGTFVRMPVLSWPTHLNIYT